MADYTSTQEDLYTDSVAGLHIQPSIMEGNFLYGSLYGKRKGWPLFRQAPLNLVAPRITGDVKIPALMKCEPGQWEGAPYPRFAYQWMSDGNDIPGATDQFWLSESEYHDTDITVEVRGYSRIGESYAWTAPVHITLIETLDVLAKTVYANTGIGADLAMTHLDNRNLIVTGVGAELAETVLRSVGYFHTGNAAPGRQDMNMAFMTCVTSIGADQRMDVMESIASSLWKDTGYTLVEGYPQRIRLQNGDGRLGVIAWDVFGTASYNKTDADGVNSLNSFDNYFLGGYNALSQNIPYSTMSQIVPLDDIWTSDIDNDLTSIEVEWLQRAKDGLDKANIYLEFLNSDQNVIGTFAGPGLWAANTLWSNRRIDEPIPANSRYVRVVVEFLNMEGEHNYAYVSNITTYIRKGSKLTLRNFGPDFQQFRLRFTKPRGHSGGSFQELEFYDHNDALIPYNGSSLAGSIDPTTDVNYLYDGIINNGGIWSGENGTIASGEAWVGYDFELDYLISKLRLTANQFNPDDLPEDFYFEGSDDGFNWIPIQYVQGLPNPSSSETLEVEIFPSTSTVVPYMDFESGYTLETTDTDYTGYGNRTVSKVRMDVDTMRVYMNTTTEVSGDLYLVRWENNQASNGYITEILAKESFTHTGGGWATATIANPVSIEVDDQVMVLVVGGVEDDIGWIKSASNPLILNPVVTCDTSLYFWAVDDLDVGDRNFNASTNRYLIDFGGTIF